MKFWHKLVLSIIIPLTIIVVMYFFHLFYLMYDTGDKPIKKISYLKKRHWITRLFWDFPKQWAFDSLYHDPNKFDMFGIHFFGGPQGVGKTMSLVWMLQRLQRDYPNLKVRTNFEYKYQDDAISKWQDIVYHHNGENGMIDAVDEIQNWFSSMQSKNFPPAMLGEITQQRKQRKVIFATGQVFTRVAKPIREQVYYYYEPLTIMGSLTFLRVYRPEMDDTGVVTRMRLKKIYMFVQNKELREAYDTHKKIIDMSDEGFTDRDLSMHDNLNFFLNDLNK